MPGVFEKLNWKGQPELLLVNAPESFEPQLAALDGAIVRRNPEEIETITFSLAFVTTLDQVNVLAQAIALKAQGDATVWFAYPKGSSKKYKCEFNRDTGWNVLGELGFEPVRQVAIDEDWSALRFRRTEYIKSMTRDKQRAMSPEGKKRVGE
jgi:hypothetical protein